MNYKLINDYEIIYLIKEGNEVALNIMFSKYEAYIWRVVCGFYVYNQKIEDLVQQGRLCLYRCIFGYDESVNVSFFSFFTICLKRTLFRELQNNYYVNPIELNEELLQYGNNKLPGLHTLLTKEEKELYEYIFVMGYKITDYARKKDISVYKAKIKYRCLLDKVKKNYGL